MPHWNRSREAAATGAAVAERAVVAAAARAAAAGYTRMGVAPRRVSVLPQCSSWSPLLVGGVSRAVGASAACSERWRAEAPTGRQ